MTQIDGKAVERFEPTLMGTREDYADMEECAGGSYVRASDYDALLAERDALLAQVDGLREGLETSKKYRDAYQECDRIATARVRELEEREGAAAAAAWIDGRDAAGATFGAHAMLISNVQPPTAPSAALAKRMDGAFNEGVEAAAVKMDIYDYDDAGNRLAKLIRALKRSGKEGRYG